MLSNKRRQNVDDVIKRESRITEQKGIMWHREGKTLKMRECAK